MKRKSQFECDADVEQHFALTATFSGKPVPPADLWEQMEQVRRIAHSKRALPLVVSAPAEFHYEPTTMLRRQPAYSISEICEVAITPIEKRTRRTTPKISAAPRTLVRLVQKASKRKRKQK